MNKNNNQHPPYLRSLDAFKKGALQSGYTENFIADHSGHNILSKSRVYDEDQVKVISMIRFEGNDSLRDHAELYIIETADGLKGLLEKKTGSD